MANSKDFIAHVLELIRPAAATSKAMFGGHGIYVDGIIVAIVVDDTLYIKTDGETRARFTDQSLPPFEYPAHDGTMHTTSYFQAPDDALDNPPAMAEWIRLGAAASMRARSQPRKRSAKTRSRAGKRASRA